MKTTILVSILMTTFIITGFSQNKIIKNARVLLNEKTRPCISLLMEPESKEVKKAWEKYLKDRYDFKLKNAKGDDLKAEKTTFLNISSNRLDFYTKITRKQNKKITRMDVFVAFGYDIYLNRKEHLKEYESLLYIIEEFYTIFLREYYVEHIEDFNKELKSYTKDKEKLIADNSKLKEDLLSINKKESKEEYEEKTIQIKKNKIDIKNLDKNISRIKDKIQSMNEKLNKLISN